MEDVREKSYATLKNTGLDFMSCYFCIPQIGSSLKEMFQIPNEENNLPLFDRQKSSFPFFGGTWDNRIIGVLVKKLL